MAFEDYLLNIATGAGAGALTGGLPGAIIGGIGGGVSAYQTEQEEDRLSRLQLPAQPKLYNIDQFQGQSSETEALPAMQPVGQLVPQEAAAPLAPSPTLPAPIGENVTKPRDYSRIAQNINLAIGAAQVATGIFGAASQGAPPQYEGASRYDPLIQKAQARAETGFTPAEELARTSRVEQARSVSLRNIREATGGDLGTYLANIPAAQQVATKGALQVETERDKLKRIGEGQVADLTQAQLGEEYKQFGIAEARSQQSKRAANMFLAAGVKNIGGGLDRYLADKTRQSSIKRYALSIGMKIDDKGYPKAGNTPEQLSQYVNYMDTQAKTEANVALWEKQLDQFLK